MVEDLSVLRFIENKGSFRCIKPEKIRPLRKENIEDLWKSFRKEFDAKLSQSRSDYSDSTMIINDKAFRQPFESEYINLNLPLSATGQLRTLLAHFTLREAYPSA